MPIIAIYKLVHIDIATLWWYVTTQLWTNSWLPNLRSHNSLFWFRWVGERNKHRLEKYSLPDLFWQVIILDCFPGSIATWVQYRPRRIYMGIMWLCTHRLPGMTHMGPALMNLGVQSHMGPICRYGIRGHIELLPGFSALRIEITVYWAYEANQQGRRKRVRGNVRGGRGNVRAEICSHPQASSKVENSFYRSKEAGKCYFLTKEYFKLSNSI